jgi:hypothetical protein
MLKKSISIDDIKIYDLDKKFGKTGYNISDLLNMPYYWANWNQNPHDHQHYYDIACNTAKNNPETILGKYYSSRPNDEGIPNLNRLSNVIDDYINDNKIKNLDIINIIENTNTLTVHLRSGDFGFVSENYVNTIYNLSKKFDKVILLPGLHRWFYREGENSERNLNSKNNLLQSYNEILKTNNNIYVYFDIPDIHISIMRLASNLLLHRGGFSTMGSFINNNNIFITNELLSINDKKWKNEVINKNITIL